MYAHLAGFHNYNVSSVSGPYSAIDPYVKPFFTPQFLSLSLSRSLSLSFSSVFLFDHRIFLGYSCPFGTAFVCTAVYISLRHVP